MCDDMYDNPLQIASLVNKQRISDKNMERLCSVRASLRGDDDDFPLKLSKQSLSKLRVVLRSYGGGEDGLTMSKLYAFKIVVGRFPLTTEMPHIFNRTTLNSIRSQSVPVVEGGGKFYNPYSPYNEPIRISDPRIRILIRPAEDLEQLHAYDADDSAEPILNQITVNNHCIYLWFRPSELESFASLQLFCVDDGSPPPSDRFEGVLNDVEEVWARHHRLHPETKPLTFLRKRASDVTHKDVSSLLKAVPPSFVSAHHPE